MRRMEFSWSREEAARFLAQQPVVHLAGSLEDGRPVLKTVHGVVVDGVLCFHSAPKGEKTSLLGRPVVACAEEVVAVVPSTFFDPERACPATTYYRSVQVHGELEEITDPHRKARALQGLMEKLQPEGGYTPIEATHPHYRAPVRGLLIAGVSLARMEGKAKLAQNRKPEEIRGLLASLWRRGEEGDPRAIELLREANPEAPVPEFLQAPAGASLHPWLPEALSGEAAALLEGAYWNDLFSAEEVRRAQPGSGAWVGARDERGALIATARAISDGSKIAWIYDVCVAERWRGKGLGRAVVRLLLEHPRVRHARRVFLGTRDAQGLYAGLGFLPRAALPPRPYSSTEMVLVRGLAALIRGEFQVKCSCFLEHRGEGKGLRGGAPAGLGHLRRVEARLGRALEHGVEPSQLEGGPGGQAPVDLGAEGGAEPHLFVELAQGRLLQGFVGLDAAGHRGPVAGGRPTGGAPDQQGAAVTPPENHRDRQGEHVDRLA